MPVSVKCLDVDKAKKELKSCPLIVRQYVKSLESAVEMSQYTTAKAIAKIKEQAVEIHEYKLQTKQLDDNLNKYLEYVKNRTSVKVTQEFIIDKDENGRTIGGHFE